MYSILNKTGKKPNDGPSHMRKVGLKVISSDQF